MSALFNNNPAKYVKGGTTLKFNVAVHGRSGINFTLTQQEHIQNLRKIDFDNSTASELVPECALGA